MDSDFHGVHAGKGEREREGCRGPAPRQAKPHLGQGRLQHATEDPELLEIPRLVGEIFDDWKARAREQLISTWTVLALEYPILNHPTRKKTPPRPHSQAASNSPRHWSVVSLSSTSTSRRLPSTATRTTCSTPRKTQSACSPCRVAMTCPADARPALRGGAALPTPPGLG